MTDKRQFKAQDLFRKFGLLMVILLMVLVMSLASPTFLTSNNIINILRQVSMNGILAIGMTFVILTGGIDLSVGSIVAVTSVIAGSIVQSGRPWLAVVAGLVVATLFGLFNGLMIAFFRLPPFIATLALTTIGRGFALVYSDGRPYTITNKDFLAIGKGAFLGIPIPIWILAGVLLVAYVLLAQTTFGRYVYAIGGNRNAAKLSGVATKAVEFMVYVISGFGCGIVGIILSARISSGQPTAGEGFELDAIAATAIGGTSMNGGVGGLFGTTMGFIIIGMLSNSLNLLNVSSFYQQIVKGFIILAAVLFDMGAKRRKQ